MFVIRNKFTFISISAALVAISIALISIYGLRLGVDFKGGALLEVNYPAGRPDAEVLKTALRESPIGEALVQPTGDNGYLIKTRALDESKGEKTALLKDATLGDKFKVEEKNYTSIGPSVGKELRTKAVASIILVSLAIILFIAYAFRKANYPVASWKYGLIAVGTLLHDIIIPVGVFAFVSHTSGAEVDTLFVVAILTILGLSVSDTIVVFDRIRENLKGHAQENFAETVGGSLSQTFGRSINTSLTVILALLALVFFGPESTRTFAIMLTAGMFFGTYSSIFLASPLLVVWQTGAKKKK